MGGDKLVFAGAAPPVDTRVEIGPASRSAGGIPAIQQSLAHAVRHMGALRGLRTLLRVNQKTGFDCPGCAWPEPDEHRSRVEFCENGAKAIASEATTGRAGPAFFAKHTVEQLGARSDQWLNDQGRLTHPMILRPGAAHYEPVGWGEAFAVVARHLRALGSPDEAAFYTSGRASNEAAFLYQLFVRQLGTNNLPDCSNLCHESSGVGLGEVIGVTKGTVSLDDFEYADCIFVVGQNPGTNHPRMLTALEQAARRGCAIVSVNPLPEVGNARFTHPQDVRGLLGQGTPLARLFLQVRINGDVALFKGIIKEMLAEEARVPGTVLYREFLAEHTLGFERFARDIEETPWSEIIEQSGVERGQIAQAALLAARARSTIACWAMGLTQHRNGVANVQTMVNFLLLRGNIGRRGAGPCPVRGHSNSQGDRSMGIWERMDDAFLGRLGAEFGFEPPRRHGLDSVDTIRAMRRGEVKVFFALGGNFLSASPDTDRTVRALSSCALTAHVSTKLHRGHLVGGRERLILPCLGRTERDAQASGLQSVTVENAMSVVSRSEGALSPASPELRSEVAIVAGLARAALGARSQVDWLGLAGNYDRIRDHIARVVPGFEDFNARLRQGAFTLPNAARERSFGTGAGKALFTVHPVPRHDLSGGRLLLMTIRSHDQYNTTIYGQDDRYRGIFGGRRVVMMNALDIAERGLVPGALVDLVSLSGDGERVAPRFVVVAYSIPRSCAATYFPEANVLVPIDEVAAGSNTPASKSVIIVVRPAGPVGAP